MGTASLFRIGMLSCFGRWDQEAEQFVYHCLNFDLVEFGGTEQEAWQNIKQTVKQHLEYCYTNYPEGLSLSASKEEWDEFAEALKKRGGKPDQVDKITFELKPPLPEQGAPIWMQGVQENVQTCSQVQ